MGARLPDVELAARTRAANQRRAARLLERQKAAGRVALTIWVDSSTKAMIDAVRHGVTLNETAERLLLAGLKQTATAPATKAATEALIPDLFLSAPATPDKDALMTWVGELLNEGLSGSEIARQLNASGKRTANGAAFTSPNLLRDYHAWARKTGAADTTAKDTP